MGSSRNGKLYRQQKPRGYPWQEWFLVGGEPTTHPDLDAIIERIAEYRAAHRPALRLTLAAPGHGERTVGQLSPAWRAALGRHRGREAGDDLS